MRELPILSCKLDAAGAREQAGRYAEIGGHATGIERAELQLNVSLDASVSRELLEELVAVERACCEFFAIDWRPDERRLTFAVASPEHAPALDVIAESLAA